VATVASQMTVLMPVAEIHRVILLAAFVLVVMKPSWALAGVICRGCCQGTSARIVDWVSRATIVARQFLRAQTYAIV
jgi:hypothetical protein